MPMVDGCRCARLPGRLWVSLFTTPESLAVGPADLSVMVEEQGSGEVLVDADVVIVLTSEDARTAPVIAHLSHAHATNRCCRMLSSSCPMQDAGTLSFNREARREASVSTDLTVANYSARRGTVWLFAIPAICVVALFAWLQVAKQGARRRRMLSPA